MNSLYHLSTSSACAMGQNVGPAITVPAGLSLKVNEVTTPKLPPPPLTAQKRSLFSSALAVTKLPSARTRSTESRLSIVRPYFLVRWLIPPTRLSPPTPVVQLIQAVFAIPTP